MSFKREDRYTVLKNSDIAEALDNAEKALLIDIEKKVCAWRSAHNKRLLKCVVVESDWPEYQWVWKMIEVRVCGYQYSFTTAYNDLMELSSDSGAFNRLECWLAYLINPKLMRDHNKVFE
jgi:hypothetical protein